MRKASAKYYLKFEAAARFIFTLLESVAYGVEAGMEMRERAGGVTFAVRVVPRARRDAIEGEHGGALRVRLTAPPVDDRANDSLRRLLAERLNVTVSAVRIVAGEKSRRKRVSIRGVTLAQVMKALDL
jgi:uncharacterized protein